MESALRLCHLLKCAAHRCDKMLDSALEDFELSLCQASVLMQIEKEGTSMSGLSRALDCHKSNVTQIVDSLEKHRVLERIPSKTDRRVYHLKLTAKGRELREQAEKKLIGKAHDCFTGLNADEQTLLDKMVQKLACASPDCKEGC